MVAATRKINEFKDDIIARIYEKFNSLNDTHREKLCFTQISTRMAAWLFPTFFICLHNQLGSVHSFMMYQLGSIHELKSRHV